MTKVTSPFVAEIGEIDDEGDVPLLARDTLHFQKTVNQIAFRVPVHVLEQVLRIIRALGAGLRPAWHKGARRNGRLSGQRGGGEYGQSQALDESPHNSVDYSSQPSAVKPQSEPRRGALWAGSVG